MKRLDDVRNYLFLLTLFLCLSGHVTQAHRYEELSVTLETDQQLALLDIALALVEDGLSPEFSVNEETDLTGLNRLIDATFTAADAAVIAQIDDKVAESSLSEVFEPLYYLGFLDHLSVLVHHYDDKDAAYKGVDAQLDGEVLKALSVLENVLEEKQ